MVRMNTIENGRRHAWHAWLAYSALLLVGGVLYFVCRFFPADLPVWLPWQFSWPVFLVTALTLGWFVRGLARTEAGMRPPLWRIVFFLLGVLLSYGVLQTHYDYLAQHMFFLHRFQHLVLHHLGPFLIALGASGSVLWRGMPKFVKPILQSRPVQVSVNAIQNPVIAPCLFVGLIYFWLIPSTHDRVMLNTNLYDLMNWSMAIDGIFFWCLVLDPRPKPPARVGLGIRALLAAIIIPPQIAVGSLIAFSSHDLYSVYQICGRILPISAIADQHYGGLILWIPPGMMSIIAFLLILNNFRLNDERLENERIQNA
jgi:putative membrane protein